jgi:hypothetical protein
MMRADQGGPWWAVIRVAMCMPIVVSAAACTRESTRVAIETQRRADDVQQVVFDRQHEALCMLLYRDLLRRLETAQSGLSPAQREALNEIWNDRDLIEFWALQNERAQALRLAGVDAKLFSEQSIVDLLWKSIEARMERARQGLEAHAVNESVGAGN